MAANEITKYKTWCWIELIGFDNQLPDFGVSNFLSNTGFVPQIVSFLLYNPDFIHTHEAGLARDRELYYDVCSYAGHPANEDRSRQAWSAHQLRGLVRELQRNNIKVYFAVFDLFKSDDWIGRFPEIYYHLKTGEVWPLLCPWKRFKDGKFYEDFLVEKLSQVISDYGFDGFHGGDGIAHPRVPIYRGDFSDDIVDQFFSFADLKYDGDKGDDNSEFITKRAEWILANHRRKLIDFYAHRIAGFWQKISSALHADGKEVIVNTAWTRDPFEAKYRYGTDYKKLLEAGVDGFVVEAASVALETNEQSESPSRFLCQLASAALLDKVYAPAKPMCWLHGIKDTEENWNALRHAPTALESEIYTMSNLYHWRSDGEIERCEDGLMSCLSDAIKHEDWNSLKEKWDLGYDEIPEQLMGITLVWSDHAYEKHIDDFISDRRWSVHRWLHVLMALGVPIFAAVNVDNIEKVKGPVVAINSDGFSQNERERLFAYENGPVVMIGEGEFEDADLKIADAGGSSAIFCGVISNNTKIELSQKSSIKMSAVTTEGTFDPDSWLNDLDYRIVNADFIKQCADILMQCVSDVKLEACESGHGNKILENEKAVSIWVMKIANNTSRFFIRNDNFICVSATIRTSHEINKINWLNPFTAAGVSWDHDKFTIKIPGRGVTVLDVNL